ncbi:hypothetical protein ACQ2H7_000430 [Candidozyma auris]
MANERTFLAWLRTSLSLTTIGIGIVQLFKLQLKGEYEEMTKFGKPIGAGFFLLGISVLLFGCYRFFNVQALLLQDKYPISYFSVSSLVASVFVLVFATVVVRFDNGLRTTISQLPNTNNKNTALTDVIAFQGKRGKVHGSLARAGKVKSQTPKVDKQEKPKKPKGRAYMRLLYTKRFVNVTLVNGKRKANSNSA